MANKVIILKNTTISDLLIAGILIPATPGQVDFSDIDLSDLLEDPNLFTLIASGDIVVNNGIIDFSAGGGEAHIRPRQHSPNVVLYTDAEGIIQEVPLGAAGTLLASTGTSLNPVFSAAAIGTIQEDDVNVVTDVDTINFEGGVTVVDETGGKATIIIDAEENTASNIGVGGVGLFKQKVGVDLQFKNINAGSNKVTITDDTGNNEIDIDIVPGNILTSTLNNDANFADDQNLWLNITADTGTTAANTTTDTITIAGGTGVDTVIVGDTLTINAGPGAPANQNLFETITADTGSTTANTTTDTLTIVGGTLVSTTVVGDTLTIDASVSINDLTDVDTTGITNGNILVFNSTSGNWEVGTDIDTGEVNTASNVGVGGVGVFKQKVGADLQFKNINAGSNKVTVTDDSAGSPPNNEIDIDIVPGNILTSTLNNDANFADDQNIWLTITADTGSTAANTTTDTVTIAGGTNVTTSIVGDVLTINSMAGVGGEGQSGTLSFFHDSGTENVFLSIDNHHQEPSGPQSQGTSVPAIMPFDGGVYAITFINRNDSVETDLEFYINGTVAFTWSIVNKKWARKSDGLSALSFSAGDQIGLFAKKVSGQKPDTVSVYMYYVFTNGTEEEGGDTTL